MVFVLFSVVYRKEGFRYSISKVRYCLAISLITTGCLWIVIRLQERNRIKLTEEITSLITSEQESIFSNIPYKRMNGVADYYAHDYTEALINLKSHLDNPVSQYYYGYMLYNGIGVDRDERTGLAQIRASADKHFFRAMGFMVVWGANCGMIDEIIPYAEMLVQAYPNSFSVLKDEAPIKELAAEQYMTLMTDFQESYSDLYVYYTYIHKSYFKLWYLINEYKRALTSFREQSDLWDSLLAIDNAWGIWELESKPVGRILMWLNANICYSKSLDVHFDYALMLLGQHKVHNNDYEQIPLKNVSKTNLRRAEKELDKALSIAIERNNITKQYQILQLLINILSSTEREKEAERLSIIVSDLKLKKYYDELVY